MALSRSQQMSRIRGRDTQPELRLRSALWTRGLRYRLHARIPYGRPDIAFPGPKVAVFIDGCFWHGCPEHYVRPRTRCDFWAEKLRINVHRDRKQTLGLEDAGWRVARFFEHRVFEDLDTVVGEVANAVAGADDDRTGTVAWRVVRVEVIDTATDLERRFLEDLYDPQCTRTVDGPRTTRKWRRPNRGTKRRSQANSSKNSR